MFAESILITSDTKLHRLEFGLQNMSPQDYHERQVVASSTYVLSVTWRILCRWPVSSSTGLLAPVSSVTSY